MIWIILGGCVIAIVCAVGARMNEQARARGPRKGTNHLAQIRAKRRRGGAPRD